MSISTWKTMYGGLWQYTYRQICLHYREVIFVFSQSRVLTFFFIDPLLGGIFKFWKVSRGRHDALINICENQPSNSTNDEMADKNINLVKLSLTWSVDRRAHFVERNNNDLVSDWLIFYLETPELTLQRLCHLAPSLKFFCTDIK